MSSKRALYLTCQVILTPAVFFLSDSSERAAVTKMRRGVARVAMLASLYVASGVVLMGTSYDKAFAGYEH